MSVDELYADPPRHRVGDRPWVGLCMIASLDGSTVVAGKSAGLSNPDDATVLATLRRAADAIVVGASTVRQEGYGPPKKAGQRIGVVSASANVDPSSKLFRSGAGFLILPEDGPPPPRAIDVVRAGRGRVDLAAALTRLDEVMPTPTFIQAEGGPHLNGSLLDADCIDELDLTVSPILTGGAGARLTAAARPTVAGFVLAHVVVDDGSFLYTRWLRRRDRSAARGEFAEELDLAVEVGRGIEVLVDAGEAQVGDLVERAQPVQDGEADLGAADLRTLEPNRILDRDRDLLDLRRRDATSLRRR
jgi:riboflavin biosynthesis pyrimidine reductase